MTAEQPGSFSVRTWLCPILLGITLVATGVAIGMKPAGIHLPVIVAFCGCAIALVVCVIQNASQMAGSSILVSQLKNLAAISNEDLDADRFQQQLSTSKLSIQSRSVLNEIFESIERDRDKLDDLQQKSARSDVRAHLAETRATQTLRIIEGLTEPVVMINQYGEVGLVNPAAVNLLGLTEVPDGKSIEDALACDSLVQLLNETRRRKLKSTRLAEIELADPDGEKHWYRVTVNTVSDSENDGASDNGFGAVAVMRDISGYKAIQRRNAEFVSAVSHEMKTPLAGIKAYTELLADGEAEDEETRDEFLGVISGQADRLQRLIDNLLNLARIEAGVVSVSKKPRSLNDLLEEAAAIVQPTAEQKNIKLNVELSPMYLGVLADRDMILQAAINLLSNAIKYTPDGGKVTLRSRMSDREVHFEVEDTGVGLSPEDCEMVFQKFYRVKKDQKMASGTGLGLPLAKHIVEDVHGGTLTVKSQLGKGSTFVIALPTVQVIEHAS